MSKLLLLLSLVFFYGEAMANYIHDIEGVKVVYVPNMDIGLVNVDVFITAGSLLDPPGKEGLAEITANMLLRGTTHRTYQQIMDEIADIGATIEADATKEYIVISGDFMPRYKDRFVDILSDVLINSTFPEDEFEHERTLAIEDLRNIRNDDTELVRRFFSLFLYKGHPMGRPTMGFISTLRKLKSEDCKDFYKAHFTKENIIVGVSGSLDKKGLSDFVKKLVKDVSHGQKSRLDIPPIPTPKGMKVLIVDKPDRTQSQVMIGKPCISWSNPDLFPLLVGNTAFGGTFTSRLMKEIREKRGLSYGAYSILSLGRSVGSLILHFYPATKDTVKTISIAFDLMKDVSEKGLSTEEIAFAKNHLANQFPFKIETPSKLMEEVLSNIIFERPPDYLEKYRDRIMTQDDNAIFQAVTRWFRLDGGVVVIVTTAQDVLKELSSLPQLKDIEVVPYDQDERLVQGHMPM